MFEVHQSEIAVRGPALAASESDPLAKLPDETRRLLRRYAREDRRQIAELLLILQADGRLA